MRASNLKLLPQLGNQLFSENVGIPEKDELVNSIYNEYKTNFEHPVSLSDFIDHSIDQSESYAAVFIPGGMEQMIAFLKIKMLIPYLGGHT